MYLFIFKECGLCPKAEILAKNIQEAREVLDKIGVVAGEVVFITNIVKKEKMY